MNSKERIKKEREIGFGRLVARELNKIAGTDYQVEPATEEPADVLLASVSGRFSPRLAQVVSIPHDLFAREDNNNIEKLKQNAFAALEQRGLTNCVVGIIVSKKVLSHGVKKPLVDRLADLVLENGKDKNVTLRGTEVYAYSPELAEYVARINVFHLPGFPRLEVDVPMGGWLPRDGRWIEEGINLKLGRYGGPAAVKDLMLIIGASAFVDAEQVQSFRNSHTPETLPFAEIWIASLFEGAHALKLRQ